MFAAWKVRLVGYLAFDLCLYCKKGHACDICGISFCELSIWSVEKYESNIIGREWCMSLYYYQNGARNRGKSGSKMLVVDWPSIWYATTYTVLFRFSSRNYK